MLGRRGLRGSTLLTYLQLNLKENLWDGGIRRVYWEKRLCIGCNWTARAREGNISREERRGVRESHLHDYAIKCCGGGKESRKRLSVRNLPHASGTKRANKRMKRRKEEDPKRMVRRQIRRRAPT